MSGFWRNWLIVWCGCVGVFGAVLVGGGIEATDGPTRLLMSLLNPTAMLQLDAPMRFNLAVLGAVTVGWSLTLLAAIRAATMLGERGVPIWRLITLSVLAWFVIDTPMSIATGYGLNAVPNLLILIAFLLPVVRNGLLFKPAAR